MEEVVPNTELKARITRWLEEKRTQRAVQSQDKEMTTQDTVVEPEPDNDAKEK